MSLLEKYGDLIFDLSDSVLQDSATLPEAFEIIMKRLERDATSHGYQEFERAWILRQVCETLRELYPRLAKTPSPEEHLRNDSISGAPERLKQFGFFFHRLSGLDQLVLLLRDKYGIPYSEISAALEIPEASLKVRRTQALRTLEEWIWERPN